MFPSISQKRRKRSGQAYRTSLSLLGLRDRIEKQSWLGRKTNELLPEKLTHLLHFITTNPVSTIIDHASTETDGFLLAEGSLI